jgi:hypothetical protein
MKTSGTLMIGIGSAAILFGIGLTPAFAQKAETRSIDQYACKDVMREHGADRDVAIAFLHGFLLGKSGRSTFDRAVLHQQTKAFIERCLDNPHEKAVDAMAKVKG